MKQLNNKQRVFEKFRLKGVFLIRYLKIGQWDQQLSVQNS